MRHKEDYHKKQLAEKLWQISQAAFEYGSPWQVEQFLSDIENPHSYYLIVEEGQDMIGYLIFHLIVDEAEVINIAVLPSYKGKKTAQKLLETGLREISQQAPAVFLEVRETNYSALGLYSKVGFKEIGRRKGYYHQPKEDGLVMRWQANQSK